MTIEIKDGYVGDEVFLQRARIFPEEYDIRDGVILDIFDKHEGSFVLYKILSVIGRNRVINYLRIDSSRQSELCDLLHLNPNSLKGAKVDAYYKHEEFAGFTPRDFLL